MRKKVLILIVIISVHFNYAEGQNISLQQIETIVDSTIDYATTFLGKEGWIYHGSIKVPDAPDFKIYQWLNTANNVVKRIALYVNVHSDKIDMFLLNTPKQKKYQQILDEVNNSSSYRLDTTVITDKKISIKYVSTYFDHYAHEDQLFTTGLKVLTLSEIRQKNTYKNIYYIQMEVEYRKD